jgi:hypothetical protein
MCGSQNIIIDSSKHTHIRYTPPGIKLMQLPAGFVVYPIFTTDPDAAAISATTVIRGTPVLTKRALTFSPDRAYQALLPINPHPCRGEDNVSGIIVWRKTPAKSYRDVQVCRITTVIDDANSTVAPLMTKFVMRPTKQFVPNELLYLVGYFLPSTHKSATHREMMPANYITPIIEPVVED